MNSRLTKVQVLCIVALVGALLAAITTGSWAMLGGLIAGGLVVLIGVAVRRYARRFISRQSRRSE